MPFPSLSQKKVAIVALLAAAAVGGVGYWHWSQPQAQLKLYGSIDMRTVDLAFEESGRLQTVLFEEGGSVKAGEVIAKLDDSRYKIARDQAASQVGVAQAQLALLLAGTRAEEIDVALARDQACYKASADRAARDEAKRTLEMLLAGTRAEEIEVARATLKQTQTQLADAERALNNCLLYAPADGVIRSRLKEPGDMVGASTPIYEMALMNPLWARVYIDEPNLGRITMGQKVSVSVDSFPDKTFDATVGFISSVAEFTPKTVQTEAIRTNLVYEVRLTVDDPQGLLRLGMPVTARLLK